MTEQDWWPIRGIRDYAESDEDMRLGCLCHHSEHEITFGIIPLEDEAELTVGYFLAPGPLFRRLWNALRYVCGYRSPFGDFGEISLDRNRAEKLRAFVDKFLRIDAECRNKS